MANNSSTFNFKKLPLGFLLALLLIASFELANALLDNYFYQPPYDGLRIKFKNELSMNSKNKYDFLILGDCYPLIGIIPKIIQDRTGLTGFNFSTHVVYSIFSSYCYFKNYLAHCAKKPKYVLVSYLPVSCALTHQDIEKDSLGVFYDFKDHNEVTFFKEFGLKAFPLMFSSLKHAYLYKDPDNILPFVQSIPDNRTKADLFMQKVLTDNGRDNLVEDNIYLTFKDNEDYKPFEVSPFFDKYLRAILDLARTNHIQVIYVVPSHAAEVYKKQKAWGNTDKYLQYLANLQKENPNLVILNPQNDFDQTFSYSGEFHLNFWGAMNLSSDLARELSVLER